MSSNYSESENTDSLVVLFPTKKNLQFCVPENKPKGDNQKDKKPRVDKLSLPTIRHIIASGIFAMQTNNKRRINNLEKLLCSRLNEGGVNNDISDQEYKVRIEEFIAKNRPRTPVDPYKFSTDDLDHPIFYDTYEKRSSTIILKSRVYNYRGIPDPIPAHVLNYKPTKRIFELAKPRRPTLLLKRLSYMQRADLSSRSTKSMSDSVISKKINRSKTSQIKIDSHKKLVNFK